MPALEAMTMTASNITSTKKAQRRKQNPKKKGGGEGVLVRLWLFEGFNLLTCL